MKNNSGVKVLVIFGARKRGRALFKRLTDTDSFEGANEFYEVDEMLFYDNDESLWNTIIDGVRIISFEELKSLDRNNTKILIASAKYIDILSQCYEIGFWRIKHLNDENHLVYTDPKTIPMILDIGNPIPVGYLGSDQWSEVGKNENSNRIYKDLVSMNKDELITNYPYYWERLTNTIQFAKGDVLEVGCGCGNITKYLVASCKVNKIYACDMYRKPLDLLKKSAFYDSKRIELIQHDIGELSFEDNIEFNTVMLSEIIEHIPLSKEIIFLNNIQKNLRISSSCFIVSTPIGFMPDPAHLRGFTKGDFIKHLEKYYGKVKDIHYTDGQQIAFGYFN